jgi:hypothetical protein
MNFIGLYDIGRLCWSDGLKLAVDFFNLLGETPDSFFYQEIAPLDQHDLDDGYREIPLAKRDKTTVANKELRGVGIAQTIEDEDGVHWRANFHYFQDVLYSYQKYLIIEYMEDLAGFENIDFIAELVSIVAAAADIPYGFACKLPSPPLRSYDYIDAQTAYVPLFNYEDPEAWKLEVPSYMNSGIAPKRHLEGKLRLVYPYNFLTAKHLDNQVQTTNLRGWILDNPENGTLIGIADDLWIWRVDQVDLGRVNMDCMNAGILISGKTPSAKPGSPDPGVVGWGPIGERCFGGGRGSA